MSAALLYFATAALCLWLSSRYVTRIPRRVAAALALIPLCFTGSALLTGRVYAPIDIAYASLPLQAQSPDFGIVNHALSDQARLMIPWRAAVRHALEQGEWPLRNPFILCGDILAAASEPAPYHPVNLLSYLLPFAISLTFVAAMQYFLAALGGWLLMRELGASNLASLVGTAGWTFSFMQVFYVATPLGFSAAMLPLVLLGARRVIERSDVPSTLLLSFTLALVLLSGHPETLLKVVALGVAYALYLLVRPENRHRLLPAMRSGIAAGVLALLISAIHLLPFLEALPQTVEYKFRQTYYTAKEKRSVSLETFARWLPAHLIPYRFGMPDAEQVKHPDTHQTVHLGYVGSSLFGLALLGLATRRRGVWFFAGIALFGMLAASRAPGVSELLAKLPLFAIALNERFVIGTCLAIPLLAAFGVDALRDSARRRVAIAQAAAIGFVALLLVITVPAMRELGLSARFVSYNATVEVVAMIAAAAAALALREHRARAIALLLLVLTQRWIEMGDFCPTLDTSVVYPRVAAFEVLADARPAPYRTIGHQFELVPNMTVHYGLEDARGYHGMTNNRLYETFRLWSRQEPIWFNRVYDLSRPFLSFLNVRYALVNKGSKIPPEWRRVYDDGEVGIVENTRVLPRATVPRRVRVGLTRRDALYEMIHADDPLAHVWIEAKRRGSEPGAETVENGTGVVSMVNEGLGYRIHAKLDAPAWIVVAETFWQGWRAETGGRELRIFPANHAFMALRLPAGAHDVRLHYLPRGFIVGRAISFATIGLLLAYGVVRWIRRRRTTRGAEPLPS